MALFREGKEFEDGEINYIFTIQNEEVNKTVQNIQKETGVELLTIHNLSNITEEERSTKKDYISIMNENIEQLKNELYD